MEKKQNKLHLHSTANLNYNDSGYLDGLRRYSRVRSLFQVGGQVLIYMLKDQSEFGFSVSPRDCAHIKQPRIGEQMDQINTTDWTGVH